MEMLRWSFELFCCHGLESFLLLVDCGFLLGFLVFVNRRGFVNECMVVTEYIGCN
jgi:hypothetical protein